MTATPFNAARPKTSLAEIEASVGKEVGVSKWFTIDQALITAFGLIPLLFSTGPGSEIQRPLAIVVIGGLITATALTLMLLPILYLRFALPKPEVSDV